MPCRCSLDEHSQVRKESFLRGELTNPRELMTITLHYCPLDYISLPRVIEILRRHSKKADEMRLTKSTTKIEGVSFLSSSLSV
jgi:hypothetical protein